MLAQARTVGLLLAVATGATSGCVARVHGSARTTAVVEAEPSLVLVDGVWVVEDYNEPVFYDEGFYWRFYGGVWYRSNVHTGNWVRVDVVPARVRTIDRPTRFVHFHAAANAEKRRGPPPHAEAHGVRGDQPGHEMGGGPPDHGDKADMKADKADAKADAKADEKPAEDKAEETPAEVPASETPEGAAAEAETAEAAEVDAEKKSEDAGKSEA